MKYRDHIEDSDEEATDNIKFYKNIIPSKPQGDLIDNIHKKWFGSWSLLEQHHGYIQWLFPIREVGMNYSAQPLSKNESATFRSDKDIQKRLLESYKLMLDFYGLVLEDESTGELSRNPITYKERYQHLNYSSHNYLRITRILKNLGMCGMEHYKLTFLRHFVLEVFKNKQLKNIERSLISFWMPTLRRREELKFLDDLVESTSKGARLIKRDGPDGWGDERGQNWSTEVYPSPLVFDLENLPDCLTRSDVLTHPNDPFKNKRSL
ncbi:hypothetical protein AKO1_013069 [Acrasis kona]|uniref:Opioid growth factor receptor (OGFr) conserved domain-containing protein n=1 Tax=Acrasis kona TaxID=1008807 RepID=A0AAW2YZC7_9EUKA